LPWWQTVEIKDEISVTVKYFRQFLSKRASPKVKEYINGLTSVGILGENE